VARQEDAIRHSTSAKIVPLLSIYAVPIRFNLKGREAILPFANGKCELRL